MKICFWSPVRGGTGVTTNAVCISAMMAIGNMGRVILLENHYSVRGVGDMIVEPEAMTAFRERGTYHSSFGVEYLLKRIYSGEPGEKLIQQSALPLLCSTLFYLPQGQIVNREVFEYEFRMVYPQLFQALENFSDYTVIDTETNRNLSSNLIISQADLVVVNLPQDPEKLAQFFQGWESLGDRSVYLIGEYQEGDPCNLSYICKEFHIPKNRIGIIPFNLEMQESMRNGHLLQFLNRNYYRAGDKQNEYLLRYARRAARMIRKNALDAGRQERKYRLYREEREIAFRGEKEYNNRER